MNLLMGNTPQVQQVFLFSSFILFICFCVRVEELNSGFIQFLWFDTPYSNKLIRLLRAYYFIAILKYCSVELIKSLLHFQ